MRTTINIDDGLLAEVKQVAAKHGKTVGSVINEALRAEFARQKTAKPLPHRGSLVMFKGNGWRPGVNLDSTSELLDLMDGIS